MYSVLLCLIELNLPVEFTVIMFGQYLSVQPAGGADPLPAVGTVLVLSPPSASFPQTFGLTLHLCQQTWTRRKQFTHILPDMSPGVWSLVMR